MHNISESESFSAVESARREELIQVMEIISTRTKSGGDGIAEGVHQAIQRTQFDFHELVRFNLLEKMIEIFQDAIDTRKWYKAMRVMNNIVPKEDFMNHPTVRAFLEASHTTAIASENRFAITNIRKMAPWIGISRTNTASAAPTKPYIHFQPKSTIFV